MIFSKKQEVYSRLPNCVLYVLGTLQLVELLETDERRSRYSISIVRS